jgi:hypothetical protein
MGAIAIFLPAFVMFAIAGQEPRVAAPPGRCRMTDVIRNRMTRLEAYAARNTGGIGNASGVMGFDSARAFLLARNSEYQLLDELLQEAK